MTGKKGLSYETLKDTATALFNLLAFLLDYSNMKQLNAAFNSTRSNFTLDLTIWIDYYPFIEEVSI